MAQMTFSSDPKNIADLFKRLLPVPPQIKALPAKALESAKFAFAGVYVTDEMTTVAAIILCDLAFAVYTGAALSLVPAHIAQGHVESGKLDQDLLDNYREVLNVLASLFNHPQATHVKFREAAALSGSQPAEIKAVINQASLRQDYEISLPNYGSGNFSVLVP